MQFKQVALSSNFIFYILQISYFGKIWIFISENCQIVLDFVQKVTQDGYFRYFVPFWASALGSTGDTLA